jgi:hypothetical protein
MVDKIVTSYRSRQVYNEITRQQNEGNNNNNNNDASTPKPQKEVQCSFCLINILFSDEFATDFATLGNIADRELLDSRRAGNDEVFWDWLQRSFVKPNPEFDSLRFLDGDVFAGQDHIDPAKIVLHDWKKLRKIWKGVNADYRAALTRFTQSGTHNQSFWDYCYGKMDVYYLQKNLAARPQLNDTVEADLPLECALSSDQGLQLDSSSSSSLVVSLLSPDTTAGETTSNTTNTLKTTRSKKNKGPAKGKQLEQLGNMLASAIKDFADKQINLKVAEKKMKCMLSNEVRRENNETRRSRDDIRQQNEDKRRGREEIRREYEHKLAEWERMQQNLRSLRQDLKDPLLDDDERADIQADIQRLQKRKNNVADDLKMGKRGEGE